MSTVRPARLAVTVVFLLNGGLFGIWAARIPAFVERLDLTPDILGLLLLCIAGGSIAGFPLAGRLTDRWGAATLTRRLLPVYPLGFLLLPFAPSPLVLGLLLAVFGAAYGAMDVAMNGWAAEVETAHGAPIMSSFHAAYSLGGGLGAASGIVAGAWGIGPALHFAVVSIPAVAIAVHLARTPWSSSVSDDGPAFALPRGGLLLVGIVAFAAAVGEGGMADWSALFLLETLGASEGRAAAGFALFSAAMVVMRLLGDRVIVRVGPVAATRASGISAVLGAAILVVAPGFAWALPGFVFLGLGYAVIVPLAFSRAARDPDISPGQAIAGVASLGYGGALIGPPLIGAVAAATSLTVGIAVIGALALVIVLGAGVMRPGDAP